MISQQMYPFCMILFYFIGFTCVYVSRFACCTFFSFSVFGQVMMYSGFEMVYMHKFCSETVETRDMRKRNCCFVSLLSKYDEAKRTRKCA